MKVDFKKFEASLPYASELYGVYQPLLGWRSRRTTRRFEGIASAYRAALAAAVINHITPKSPVGLPGHWGEPVEANLRILPGDMVPGRPAVVPAVLQSAVGMEITKRLAAVDVGDQAVWDKLFSPEGFNAVLTTAAQAISGTYGSGTGAYAASSRAAEASNGYQTIAAVLDRESRIAGGLQYLYKNGQRDVLATLFTSRSYQLDGKAIADLGRFVGLGRDGSTWLAAHLSPVGLVHIFRQYFFEFDSFLGPPVQHVWLSPGATVELVEISTRRTLTERTSESAFDTIQKSEKSETSQDELSDAVKEENQNNDKFGVSVDSTSNAKIGIFSTQLTARTSYESGEARTTAREQTHKQLRQQTAKLSSEIKQSFKSTFRTVTETTDTSSKRYVLTNTTDNLLNYELRRKMRQVGVQVQDLGTELCWQTYVDRPGDELGIAKLVHIGQPPETNVQPAVLIPQPDPYQEEVNGSFVGVEDDDYEMDLDPVQLFPKHGYVYDKHGQVQWLSGNTAEMTITPDGSDPNLLHLHVKGHDEDEDPPTIPYRFTVNYVPTKSYLTEIDTENTKRLAAVDQEKERLAKEAFFTEARDRVKAASNIQRRPFDELREEERIIVYRNLIRQLFRGIGLKMTNAPTYHVLAELVESLFDVDKMLYFVAPEWWVPRTVSRHSNPQNLKLPDPGEFEQEEVSDWGGVDGNRPDSYYITEDSSFARLGSSLGWVLQLDGDNLRNAFLNAPWVKAVIPMRPGREMEALDWLTTAGVEGSDGLDDVYQEAVPGERAKMLAILQAHEWDDPALQNRYQALGAADLTVHDAIRYLAVVVGDEYQLSRVKVDGNLPDGTPISYLPTDSVFEHGFDPLAGGFRAAEKDPFEVFDQWIEVLPTDQSVAVEVAYDPKTGMQV